MSTIILGGGIIGLSTAYYLSQSRPPNKDNNPPIHIVDSASSLLLSASGYAGGFLAEDWFSPHSASLGALSFKLHRELAQEHDGARRWGYSGSHVYSLSIDERGVAKKGRENEENWLEEGTSRAEVAPQSISSSGRPLDCDETLRPDGTPIWLTPQPGGTFETIGTPTNCAQLEPKELCNFLISECGSRGVQIHLSSAPTSLSMDSSNRIAHLNTANSSIACTDLVLAAGAWTPSLFETLFASSKLRIPVSPVAGHSLLFTTPRHKAPLPDTPLFKLPRKAYAVYSAPTRSIPYAPEAFARHARSGEAEVWIGGLNDPSLPLPKTADDVKPLLDRDAIVELRTTSVQLTGLAKEDSDMNEDDITILREGLCFRPVSDRGGPIVCRIEEGKLGGARGNVFVATGHGPWGISLSLGTGLVVSEMVQGRETSADVRALRLR
jgi:glycine/D-amino acid oxidase-like deaminating enzyme